MNSFDYEELLTKYRYPVLILLAGLILLVAGIFVFRSGLNFSGSKVEILNDISGGDTEKNITVEISGEVIRSGVYKLPDGSRIEDLLVAAGGFSGTADRVWVEKYLNRAAKVTDGQKVYIPKINEHTDSSSANMTLGDQTISPSFSSDSNIKININSASLTQLDSLPGIGQVYGQNIIDHRPYSDASELLSKGVLKKSLYEKIKDMVSVY